MCYLSIDADELDIEYKCGIGWNDGAKATGTVSFVGGNGQDAFLSGTHALQTFVPTFYDLADAESEIERRVTITA